MGGNDAYENNPIYHPHPNPLPEGEGVIPREF